MNDVGPWMGQRLDSPACLHFGAVSVEAAITGDAVARWCPSCEGTQYAPSLSLDPEMLLAERAAEKGKKR